MQERFKFKDFLRTNEQGSFTHPQANNYLSNAKKLKADRAVNTIRVVEGDSFDNIDLLLPNLTVPISIYTKLLTTPASNDEVKKEMTLVINHLIKMAHEEILDENGKVDAVIKNAFEYSEEKAEDNKSLLIKGFVQYIYANILTDLKVRRLYDIDETHDRLIIRSLEIDQITHEIINDLNNINNLIHTYTLTQTLKPFLSPDTAFYKYAITDKAYLESKNIKDYLIKNVKEFISDVSFYSLEIQELLNKILAEKIKKECSVKNQTPLQLESKCAKLYREYTEPYDIISIQITGLQSHITTIENNMITDFDVATSLLSNLVEQKNIMKKLIDNTTPFSFFSKPIDSNILGLEKAIELLISPLKIALPKLHSSLKETELKSTAERNEGRPK